MSETILRTTNDKSGNYHVFAAATVGGFQPMKGFAIHTDITARLPEGTEYVNITLEGEGKLDLVPQKATSATVQYGTEGPAVRHVYFDPEFLAEFGEVDFNGKETDLSALPTVSIVNIEASSEEEYEADKEAASSAEEEADALFGDADDSEESEADADESEESDDSEETVEISDEEVGIVEN